MLSGLIHERRIDPRLEELLAASEADAALAADPLSAANLREIRRDRDRAALLPTALVREMAETTSRALKRGAMRASAATSPPSRPGWRRYCG